MCMCVFVFLHTSEKLGKAMNDLVKETLEGAQRTLRKEKAAGNAAIIDDAVAKMGQKERAKARVNHS